MGLFTGTEANGPAGQIVAQAQRAWDGGTEVFIGRLVGGLREDSGDRWARTIQAVEQVGWRMDTWAVSENVAWPLFRRES
jgi:hypothetical protein